MIQVTVDNNQSIWDLAIEQYGSVDGVGQLILDNPMKLNFNDDVVAGTKIIVREEMIINKPIVDYLNKKGIRLATAIAVPGGNVLGDFNNDFNNDFN
jgi:hypothetical protein